MFHFLWQIFSTILSHSLEEKLWMCFHVSLPFDRFAAEAPECKKQERNRQIREPKLDLNDNFVWNSWPSLSLSVTWIRVWRLRGLPTCSRSKNCWFDFYLVLSWQSVHQRFKEIGYKKDSVITRRLKTPRRQGSQEERKTPKSEHPTSPIRTWLYEGKNAKNKTSGWQQPRPPRPQKAQRPLLRMPQPLSRLITSWVFSSILAPYRWKKKLQCMFLTSSTEGDNNNAARRSRTLAERIWPTSKVGAWLLQWKFIGFQHD